MVFVGSILLTGQNPATRIIGFLCMALSNWFFFLYGLQVESTALITSSAVFAVVNIYGIGRNLFYLKGKE